jgi:hypothetical protein
MSEETNPQAEIKIVGYCRVCGTGLDEANVRTSNGTIYCAQHVPAEQAPPSSNPSAGPQQTYQSAYAHSPYTAPPTPPGGNHSPGAAFLLGMIPGVGAIYNGQYVKGLIHAMILVVLIAAADHSGPTAGPMAGFLIVAFWFYMAFEAYHTARRVRDGLPLDEFSGFSDRGQGSRFPVAAVLLIVFGIIFLLDNLNLFEIERLLKFWPAGMIALGLYMLYLRMSEDKK